MFICFVNEFYPKVFDIIPYFYKSKWNKPLFIKTPRKKKRNSQFMFRWNSPTLIMKTSIVTNFVNNNNKKYGKPLSFLLVLLEV